MRQIEYPIYVIQLKNWFDMDTFQMVMIWFVGVATPLVAAPAIAKIDINL